MHPLRRLLLAALVATALVAIPAAPAGSTPAPTKDLCKGGGFETSFSGGFDNQGECVSTMNKLDDALAAVFAACKPGAPLTPSCQAALAEVKSLLGPADESDDILQGLVDEGVIPPELADSIRDCCIDD